MWTGECGLRAQSGSLGFGGLTGVGARAGGLGLEKLGRNQKKPMVDLGCDVDNVRTRKVVGYRRVGMEMMPGQVGLKEETKKWWRWYCWEAASEWPDWSAVWCGSD